MPGLAKNSAIYSWINRQTSASDIFSNSLILKWALKLTEKAAHIFSFRGTKIAASCAALILLGFLGLKCPYPNFFVVASLIAVFILIWKRTELGIVLLIISFTITPKIHIGMVNLVTIPIRIDDFLLVIIALVTLVKISTNKLKLKATSLDLPILLFINIAVISTLRGFFIHTIDRPIINLFYVSKIIEFFLIFYLVVYNTRGENQIRLYLGFIIASCVVVSLIGIWEHFHPLEIIASTNYYRLFERGLFYGESNHFGGYFVFLLGLAGGFALFSGRVKNKFYWSLFILLTFLALLWTYSRQSYLALLGPLVTLPLFRKNSKRHLAILACLCVIFSILFFSVPSRAKDRLSEIKEVLLSKDPYHSSFAFRLIRWNDALGSFKEYPLLGTGLGSRHRAFYESNHIMLLSELGLLGHGLFLFILSIIFLRGRRLFKGAKDDFSKILSIGFIAGFIGLVLHSLTSNAFMITRIAGPFWVMAGLLFILPCAGVDAQS